MHSDLWPLETWISYLVSMMSMTLTDGLTLTCFSMMDVNTNISKHVEGFIPSVCTESPAPGMYGQFHCTALKQMCTNT